MIDNRDCAAKAARLITVLVVRCHGNISRSLSLKLVRPNKNLAHFLNSYICNICMFIL